MVSSQRPKPPRAQGDTVTVGRLFLLDLSDDRIVSLNSDGSDRKVIVTECRYPDGVARRCRGGTHLLDQYGGSQLERRLY